VSTIGNATFLWFVYVLNFLDRQLLSILAKPIQDSLHITDGQLGLIGGLYFAFFYCFIAIPVGWLADRTNRVAVLSLACGDLERGDHGLRAGGQPIPAARRGAHAGRLRRGRRRAALLCDHHRLPSRRARAGMALGIYNLGPPIGAALGIAFGASIAAAFSWRDAFIIIGVVGIVGAAGPFIVREPKRGGLDAVGGATAAEKGQLLVARCGCSSRIPC
jgi:MFS family permease